MTRAHLRREALTPVVVIGALLVAVTLVPWPLASRLVGAPWDGPASLARAVSDALAQDWRSNAALPGAAGSALAGPTRFWQAFHLVKAILAGGLLAVSVRAATRSWASSSSTTDPGRPWGLVRSLSALACAGVALLLSVANLQGAIAPLTSVLGFLPEAAASGSDVAGAIRDALATGTRSPMADAIVTDFARYHLALAVLGSLAATALSGGIAVAWRQKRVVEGLVIASTAAFFVIVVAANIGTWLNLTPALDAFLAGIPAR